MKTLNPYIVTDQVEHMIKTYQYAFGGDIIKLNEHQGSLLHAELQINEAIALHLSSNYGKPFSNEYTHIVMSFDSAEEEKEVFNRLAEHGEVVMQLEKTFFGSIHGQIKDELGIIWLFNYFLQK